MSKILSLLKEGDLELIGESNAKVLNNGWYLVDISQYTDKRLHNLVMDDALASARPSFHKVCSYELNRRSK